MKRCRVSITTQCNFNCTYCCMEQQRVLDTYKISTMKKLITSDYDEYLITGGEPTLSPSKLITLIECLNYKRVKVYLYSNGSNLHFFKSNIDFLKGSLSGINISIHEQYPDKSLLVIKYLKDHFKIRLHINDEYYKINKSNLQFENVTYQLWKMNDCDGDLNNNTDRLLI